MARIKVRTDAATQSILGDQVLSELRAQLKAVDCQSCGRRFRRWHTPALAVYADGDLANVTLHHAGCHPPAWRDGLFRSPDGRPHLTWRAGTFVLPAFATLGASSVDIPIFLVNPSYEAAILHNPDGQGWRVSTLEYFGKLGLALDGPKALTSETPTPALTASIDSQRISVTVYADGVVHNFWPNIPLDPNTANLALSRGSIVVAVTSTLDVNEPLPVLEFMLHAIFMRVGVAALGPPKRQ